MRILRWAAAVALTLLSLFNLGAVGVPAPAVMRVIGAVLGVAAFVASRPVRMSASLEEGPGIHV